MNPQEQKEFNNNHGFIAWLRNLRCWLFHNVQRYDEHPDVWTCNCHTCDREWYEED